MTFTGIRLNAGQRTNSSKEFWRYKNDKVRINQSDRRKKRVNKKGCRKGIFSSCFNALVSGEKVQIVGFGTFEVRDRKEKLSKNPQTGETITVPAKKAPAFKAGKALKDAVNA